tara:strand:- start:114 stop:377 length:264 start_codon:yes stop_codon:yes gene_type:complete
MPTKTSKTIRVKFKWVAEATYDLHPLVARNLRLMVAKDRCARDNQYTIYHWSDAQVIGLLDYITGMEGDPEDNFFDHVWEMGIQQIA